jgi:hypothetical protein
MYYILSGRGVPRKRLSVKRGHQLSNSILPKLNTILKKPFWLRPWMLSLGIAVVYCLVTLAHNAWDPMAFVLIGHQFDPAHGTLTAGYDGQFAYQIALHPAGAASLLDAPAYRYQRILYPLLARVLAFGRPALIPWMLILINVVSLAMGTYATEQLMVGRRYSRWYSLAYAFFVGLWISLRLDLTEPLAFALVQWGVVHFDHKKIWISMIFFALAALAREVTLIFAAACAISLFVGRRRLVGAAWGWGVVLPFGLWQIFLHFWQGAWGVQSGGAMASDFDFIPFHGWWGFHPKEISSFVLLSIVIVAIAIAPVGLGIVAGLRSFWKRRLGPGVWMLLLNSLFIAVLPSSNVLNLTGLVRILIGLMVAILDFGALENSSRALRYSQLWIVLLVFGEGLIAYY